MNYEGSFAFVRHMLAVAIILGWGWQCSGALADKPVSSQLTIVVPAAEGSSWSRSALAIRDALREENLVGSVDIVHSPGAGGMIALAQFIGSRHGDPSVVIIGGRTILGASAYNRSRISLLDTSPVARLAGTAAVIAVPAASPIRDLGDLIETARAEPTLVKWVGGSEGSLDELIVQNVMTALGASRSEVSFNAVPGGGDEIATRLASGHFTAGVSSVEEFAEFAKQGNLRIIAVSSSERLHGLAAPTLMEYGVEVSFDDWRGVFAPPGLSAEQSAALDSLFARLADSPAWARQLSAYGWRNLYMPSTAFRAFIDTEAALTTARLNAQTPAIVSFERLALIVGRHYRWTIAAGVISVLLLTILLAQRVISQRKLTRLRANLDTAQEAAKRVSAELEKSLARAAAHISAEFTRWKLTDAEQEIGWMLLKGLSLRIIAEARGTSERTVRQQARAIYAKSGLGNRADLAAFFLEDLCFGHTPDEGAPPSLPLANDERVQA